MLSFRMTALVAAVAMSSLAVVAGCGVSTDSDHDDDEAVGDVSSALQNNGGGTTKTKGELEADGWTCKLLEGTSLTFCTKPGTPGSWSCNDRGTCTQNKTTPPPVKPPIFSSSGVVFGGTLAPAP